MKTGFGNAPSPFTRAKPLKRPSQARALFTVEAIYQAFVRIWQRDGWARLTTRAVALESGFAVGTLYDYFPSKEALLSGYVRMCVETLLRQLDEQVIAPGDMDSRSRIQRLLRLTCDPRAIDLPLFDAELLGLEHQIAEPKHHQRVFEELSGKWREAFAACTDLPPVSEASIDALVLLAWGARRYSSTVQRSPAQVDQWLLELEHLINLRLDYFFSGGKLTP
jgi:AcrR family transcriptional regulator